MKSLAKPLDLICISKDAPISQLRDTLNRNGLRTAIVVQGRKLFGICTDGNLRRNPSAQTVADATSIDIIWITETATRDDSISLFASNPSVDVIPVVNLNHDLVDYIIRPGRYLVPLAAPYFQGNETLYVMDCMETGWISSAGQYVRRFEEQFQSIYDRYTSLSCSNGTVAIELAIRGLGIKQGSFILVPDITFAATANAVISCGCVPVLCPVDRETMCIDITQIPTSLASEASALICVSLYGWPPDMLQVREYCNIHKLYLIEDVAEAFGSTFNSEPIGTFGDASTFSFFGNKTITTGEGGMVIFKSKEAHSKAKLFRDHGMSPTKRYWHLSHGTNYRMTNLQAAIGVAQLEQLSKIINKKIEIADLYHSCLSKFLPLHALPPKSTPSACNINWLYAIFPFTNHQKQLDTIQRLHNTYGLEIRPTFTSLHEMPAFRDYPTCAKEFSSYGLLLPSRQDMTSSELEYICRCLQNILEN